MSEKTPSKQRMSMETRDYVKDVNTEVSFFALNAHYTGLIDNLLLEIKDIAAVWNRTRPQITIVNVTAKVGGEELPSAIEATTHYEILKANNEKFSKALDELSSLRNNLQSLL